MDIREFRQQYRLALAQVVGNDKILDSWGSAKAKIVQIGQAPSLLGVKSGRPWDDKSGQKLRDKWYQLSKEEFYNQNNFYFTALGMYFPGKAKHGGDARPSLALARKWLPLELSIVKPKLYILIGKMAGDFFFPHRDFKTLVFYDQKINGTRTLVLPHPSPLNIKWYRDNPSFETQRILEVRAVVKELVS